MSGGRKKGRDAMNAVTRKLKSRSGISLAIALVFFLLCAMVGTVVLSAASASAGSTARERQLYRETAALTSAAQLLSRDIQGMTFTGSYIRRETVTTTVVTAGDQTSTKVETGTDYQQVAPTIYGSKLFSVQNNGESLSDSLGLTQRYFANQGKWTVVVGGPRTIVFHAVEAQHIPEVTGSITVGEDYTLTVVLRCGKNTLTMSFTPQAVSKTEVANPATVTVNETTTQKITVTTYSTTLTWGKPVMQEGGANNG